MIIVTVLSVSHASAQAPNPFLITPYFGTKGLVSNFDHEFPNYGADGTLVGYDGVRRGPPAAVNNCTNGLNGSCYNGHDGIDFALTYEHVIAATAGIVTRARWDVQGCHNGDNCNYGLVVEVNHGNGHFTRYGHLSAVAVMEGQQVTAGQIIGTSGNTGNSSGAHLHFGVLRSDNNRAIDPFGWSGGYLDPWAQHAQGATSYCLWKDGQWANYCGGFSRPIPAPTNGGERHVDDSADNADGFSKGENNGAMPPPFNNVCTGDCASWTRDASTGLYGDMYSTWVNGNTPDSWAKWNAAVSNSGGMYEVFAYIPDNYATSWQAPYTIRHFNNATQITGLVDQYGLGNQWVSLGTYYMTNNDYVFTTDATGEPAGTRRLGADTISFARRGTAYLTGLNANGWVSTIKVRNNGGGPASVYISVFNEDGELQCSAFFSDLSSQSVWSTSLASCPSGKSAKVDASQDMAAVVENESSAAVTSYVGNQISSMTAYLPNLVVRPTRQAYVSLQNAGTNAATVSLNFYNRNGSLVHARNETIPVNGSTTLWLNNIPDIVNGFAPTSNTGSMFASVTNGVPIAVSAQVNYTDQNGAYAYSGVAAGDTTLWTPGVFRRVVGTTWQLYSAVNVQNLSAGATTIHVQFINRTTGTVTYEFDETVPGLSSVAYNTRYQGTTPSYIWNPLIAALGDAWSGSVRVTSNNGAPLGGVYLYFPAQYGADMIAVPLTGQGQSTTGSLVAPVVYRQQSSGLWTRWSTVLVQNTDLTNSAAATVRIFDANGVQQGSDCPITIPARGHAALNLKTGVDLPSCNNLLINLGTNFSGSMTVTATNGRALLGIVYDFYESTQRLAGDTLIAR